MNNPGSLSSGGKKRFRMDFTLSVEIEFCISTVYSLYILYIYYVSLFCD